MHYTKDMARIGTITLFRFWIIIIYFQKNLSNFNSQLDLNLSLRQVRRAVTALCRYDVMVDSNLYTGDLGVLALWLTVTLLVLLWDVSISPLNM